MYTQQQENIKARIESLLKLAGNNLRIKVVPTDERSERNVPQKTSAVRAGQKVHVVLVEAYSKEELDEWAEALNKADELLRLIEQENLHYANNPNFSKAISFIIDTIQQPGLYA